MDYDRIILELYERVKTLEERVNILEGKTPPEERNSHSETSKKYRFLADYLYNSGKDSIRLTFAEIEDILKIKLPNSAHNHRAFWANTTSHSIALSWLNVGYQTVEVNIDDKYIVFEKQRTY